MEEVEIVKVERLVNGDYVRPVRCHYRQAGRLKQWEFILAHDSVAILLFHVERKSFVLVRQFRPAVYICSIPGNHLTAHIDYSAYPATRGLAYELCAGIVDKEKTLPEIAQAEIEEECGYRVPLEKLEFIARSTAVGTSGVCQLLFYAEIDDSMKVGVGGGNDSEGELIEVVEIPVADSIRFIYDPTINKPTGVMFAILWFAHNKAAQHQLDHCLQQVS